MAEIIGILSGTITFIDAGSKIFKFFSDLQHAPQKVEAHQQHLRSMLQLVQGIHRDLDRLSNGTGVISPALISQPDLDEVEDLVRQALDKLKELEGILDGLAGPADGTRLKRSWKTLRAHDTILGKFQELTGFKDSLQIWMQRQTLLLSGRHRLAVEALGGRIDSAHSYAIQSVASVESSLIGAIQTSQNDFNRRFDELKAQNELLVQLVSRPPRFLESRPSSSIGFQSTYTMTRSSPQLQGKRWPLFPPLCTCTSRPSPFAKFWGPIIIQSKTKNIHEKGCPLHGRSTRQVTLTIKLSMLQFVLDASFGPNGVSLNQNIKGPVRLVDHEKSDAFVVMGKFHWCLFEVSRTDSKQSKTSSMESLCRELTQKLSQLFREGKASAHDVDQYGTTLLSNFVYRIPPTGGNMPSEAISSVIATLIAFGADPNCISRPGIYGHLMENILSPVTETVNHEEFRLERLLLEVGCEPQPLSGIGLGRYIRPYQLRVLFRTPDLVQDMGFPHYYKPIFEKSASGLHSLIRKGQNWNEWDSRFPAPVECAVYWVEGLEILLNAGADVRDAISMAINCHSRDAIQLLLSWNCPSFFGQGSESLEDDITSYSILGPRRMGDDIETLEILTKHIANCRKKLAQTGLEVLPPKTPLHEHILDLKRRDLLLDEFALDVWKALKRSDSRVTDFLWPGTDKSVYFTLMHDHGQDPFDVVKLLYDHGFKELNIVDDKGWTPLLLACYFGKDRSANLFLANGAHPDSRCLWVSSNEIYRDNLFALDLWNELSPRHKYGCSCYCSTCGCIPPVRALQGVTSHRRRRDHLVSILPKLSNELQETCYIEACRLEVFERLGMAHTCCRREISPWLWRETGVQEAVAGRQLPPEEIQEIQEEDTILKLVLDDHMKLFNTLRASFQGSAHEFRDAWWGALDLLLPELGDQVVRESEWKPEMQATDEVTEEDAVNSWVDTQSFRNIVRHFSNLVPSVAKFFQSIPTGHSLLWVEEYLRSAGVTVHIVGSYDQPRTELMDFADPLANHCWNLARDRSRKTIIKSKVIHPMTAALIRDFNIGRRIPPRIYDFLVSEGLMVDGELTMESQLIEQPDQEAQ